MGQFANADGSKIVPIDSPRVGIIQVGEGLFLERFRIQPKQIEAPANSIARLGSLFHEARHSDGNGASLGFGHAVCPAGHPYGGQNSCDRNRNGPYSVASAILKILLRECRDCSVEEKESLRVRILDYSSRIILSTEIAPNPSRVPRYQFQVAACNLNRKLGFKETSDCREARENLDAALNGKVVTTTDWDATPEMITQ
jgi:hypothetical protein